MADYQCPECGASVSRQSAGPAARAFGAAGMLIGAAFADFECPEHGVITRGQFPPEVQSKMRRGSIGLVAGAVVLLIVVIALLIALN